ncbi:MAG: hypothetical protein RL318_1264 [Fibrobacterota bacterium]
MVVGVRADSTYCQPGAPLLFGIRQGDACIADNTVEMWDRSGNLLWKRFQKSEFRSFWYTSSILSNGDILTAGLINRDTLAFDTSRLARNPLVQTARISRWSRAGDLLWSWRITSAPDSFAAGSRGLSIHWTDTLANGDIVFLGRSSYASLIIPQTDTLDISSSLAKVRISNLSEAGFFGCLSSQGALRWIKPFSAATPNFSVSYLPPSGAAAIVRGNEILLARSAPTDTLWNNTKVILARYDASGSLLNESSPLDTTTASVHGMAKAQDGSILLSICPKANAVQIASKTVIVPADSASFNRPSYAPTIGRNLLLLLDSTLAAVRGVPLTGWRRPGSWNVGRAPRHGWLAWGEDWTGYNDTANLLLLDDSLKVLDASPLLENVMSAHAYGDELWLAGSVQGATMTGNGGYMMATRMEFGPHTPLRLRQSPQGRSRLWQKGNRVGWTGTGAARLRLFKASGQLEADVPLDPGESVPLTSGLHLVQMQVGAIEETRLFAIP